VQTQQRVLETAVADHGWEVVDKDATPQDWWADEVWTLQSVWAPRDCRIYLAFLVDPQLHCPRKGEGVWAVSAATGEPVQWSETVLTLGRDWRGRLPDFLRQLAGLRIPKHEGDRQTYKKP
jgi:hypothetical protein